MSQVIKIFWGTVRGSWWKEDERDFCGLFFCLEKCSYALTFTCVDYIFKIWTDSCDCSTKDLYSLKPQK